MIGNLLTNYNQSVERFSQECVVQDVEGIHYNKRQMALCLGTQQEYRSLLVIRVEMLNGLYIKRKASQQCWKLITSKFK